MKMNGLLGKLIWPFINKIENVLLEIKSKWSGNRIERFFIQDNARPHASTYNLKFLHYATSGEFEIRLAFKNSNMKYFRAFHRVYYSINASNVDDTIEFIEQILK